MTPQNYELGKDEIRKVDWAMAQVQEELRELTSSVESPAAAKTDGDNPEAEDTNPKTEEVSTEPVDTTAKTDNNTENGETKTINMSKYLKDGLDNLGKLREILVKVESEYRTILKTESDSWGTETSISFNQFMSDTYDIKQGRFNGIMTYEEATVEIERLKTKIDVNNPRNFAYYYEIYQLQNFIKP